MHLLQTIRRIALFFDTLKGEHCLLNTSSSPWLFGIGLPSSLYKAHTFQVTLEGVWASAELYQVHLCPEALCFFHCSLAADFL